ncbi:glycosyltransferase family 92 protein F13G3.3-like [Centruroides vittatus]|uniref:glycosyltransferase family 92 protein F13G3.3-like n=1 Tax=Centruroides vittatus TaxID=120091 RepID=UPI0035101976
MWVMKKSSLRRNRIKIIIAFLVMLFVVYVIIYFRDDSDLHIPSLERISSSWHNIFGTTFMYSAYWDDREEPHVKILASGPYDERLETIKCYLLSESLSITKGNATFSIMDFENHGNSYTPIFFFCYPNDRRRPTKIMLSARNGRNSTWMPVRTLAPVGNIKNKIAVCVRPLFGTFSNNNLQVAEFIAFYHLLGADHFVFYNFEADSSLLRLLREISSSGISMDILPWDMPQVLYNMWSYGQVLSITDCVYRVASTHEFALVIDFDEFIVPRQNYSLQRIIASSNNTNRIASFVFKHVFFCLDYANFPHRMKLPLITQTVDLRKSEIFPWSNRAKSIVRPLATILPGIHKILLTRQRWKPMSIIKEEVALMNHYRRGVCSLWNKLGYESVQEKIAFKYRNALLESLPIKVWRRLYDRSNLVL